jgi:hypothetical protein
MFTGRFAGVLYRCVVLTHLTNKNDDRVEPMVPVKISGSAAIQAGRPSAYASGQPSNVLALSGARPSKDWLELLRKSNQPAPFLRQN